MYNSRIFTGICIAVLAIVLCSQAKAQQGDISRLDTIIQVPDTVWLTPEIAEREGIAFTMHTDRIEINEPVGEQSSETKLMDTDCDGTLDYRSNAPDACDYACTEIRPCEPVSYEPGMILFEIKSEEYLKRNNTP